MNYKILLLIGVCVKIATTSNCNQPADLSLDTLQCCFQAWKNMELLNDPCYQSIGDKYSEECILDCLYTSHGILVNGSIVVENATQFLRSFDSEEYQQTFIPAFERCNKFDWNELTVKFGHLTEHPDGKCSPKALIFDACVALYVISNCPKDIWEKSEHCTTQLTFLNECIFNP